jgi:hypothetical protein
VRIVRGTLVFIFVFVGLSLVRASAPSLRAAPLAINITNPSGAQSFGEAPDYATLAWNDPWDMSGPLDVRLLDSPTCVPQTVHWAPDAACPAGMWCGKALVADPDLFLLHPGYPGALLIGRTGHAQPINANTYTRLTLRMYVEGPISASEPGFQVMWTNGTVADIGNESKWGQTRFYPIAAGWHIYSIDLTADNDAPFPGSLKWSGQITGLRLDPGAQINGQRVRLDWARLSPPTTRTVQWNTNEGGNVTFKLQQAGSNAIDPVRLYNTSGSTRPLLTVSASARSFALPVSLPPGDWHVHMQISGGSSAGPAGPWRVQAAPTLSFVAPSTTSGEDYAQAHFGKPWDMTSPNDVNSVVGISSGPTFANGILSATSAPSGGGTNCGAPTGDPQIYMLNYVDQPGNPADTKIATGKYHYLSFRLRLDGAPDVSHGWVARVVWHELGFDHCGVTLDIPLHGGWNDVGLDLAVPGLLEVGGCQSAWQAIPHRSQLRIDPHEVPQATAFHLDYVKLTATDRARAGGAYAIRYLASQPNAAMTFYYDTDRNPANGRTRIGQASAYSPGAAAPYRLYLPLMLRLAGNLGDPPGTQSYAWNLSGVPPGTYYINAELNNGFVTTNWYSNAPLIVAP